MGWLIQSWKVNNNVYFSSMLLMSLVAEYNRLTAALGVVRADTWILGWQIPSPWYWNIPLTWTVNYPMVRVPLPAEPNANP